MMSVYKVCMGVYCFSSCSSHTSVVLKKAYSTYHVYPVGSIVVLQILHYCCTEFGLQVNCSMEVVAVSTSSYLYNIELHDYQCELYLIISPMWVGFSTACTLHTV